jgi:predicted O-methyltransferase YrrM
MADPNSRAGARYDDPEIIAFVQRAHVRHDPALQRAFDAPAAHSMPAIQVGPSEGKLLGMLIRMIGARSVVEVGTLAGYSTIWLGRALPADGQLYSIEIDAGRAAVARANIEAAGLADRAEVLIGPGAEMLDRLSSRGPFDAVFLDADKGGYAGYARWAQDNLRAGGLLLADNAYLFGDLLADREEAPAMRRFHENLPRAFDSVCIPTPDGLVLAVRR